MTKTSSDRTAETTSADHPGVPLSSQPHQGRRALFAVAVLLLFTVAAVAVGESLGWPFLAAPLERLLSEKLDRRVSFAVDVNPTETPSKAFGIRFIGGLRLAAPRLEIAAPAWSTAPHLLLARDIDLDLRYIDLWRAKRGQPLSIKRLQSTMLDANLERLADGRASWQFGPNPAPPPVFGHLQVTDGTLRYKDVPQTIDVVARLSLVNGTSEVTTRSVAGSSAPAVIGQPDNVLQVDAKGHYRDLPLKIELVSSGVLPWTADEARAVPVPLTMNAMIGRASFTFKGTATDALHLNGFTGRFTLKGPSLAAVGDPFGVTLPTTSAFHADGVIVRQGDNWQTVLDDVTVGTSRLNGAFTYDKDKGRAVPLLAGRLGGARLLLADLGPVVGMTPATTAGSATSPALPQGVSKRGKGMVLPNRPYDLAAMRAMDANVLIDINEVDLSSNRLEPLRPLHTHLQLRGGVLTLGDIDARTGEGKLKGELALDGRNAAALWSANLRWDDVQLERWIHQSRKDGSPPFVTGHLQGRTSLKGQGKSTAEILATLNGQFRSELRDGTVSHFVVEVAGLDLAQGLGLLIKGDDALPMQCAVVDLIAESGVFRPRVMVLDTKDSAIWVDGSLSLATEALDLRAVVMPKDFSPLTLRTPLRVRGTFAQPVVSLEKGPLVKTLASSFLMALVNPLAALLPLIDRGDPDAAARGAAGCQNLMQRSNARRTANTRAP